MLLGHSPELRPLRPLRTAAFGPNYGPSQGESGLWERFRLTLQKVPGVYFERLVSRLLNPR